MTESLWLAGAGLALGLVLLVKAADVFVDGASAVAGNLGVRPLVVGLLVVGFGTSAPELLVSGLAAWDGRPGLAVGNAVGSNIANVALILGATALVAPLTVQSGLLKREMPVPLAAMLLALALLADGVLGRGDGIVMLAAFGGVVAWTLVLARRERVEGGADPITAEYAAHMPAAIGTGRALLRTVVGLVVLLAGARLLVWSAVQIARGWGMSDLVIGLTVVAVGTSLPELAAALAAARKGKHDIAVGNVVGSNTFNILAAVGVAGTIGPGAFDPEVLTRDFPVMIGLTVALFAMAYGVRGPGRINRVEGTVLLLCFAAYLVLLALEAGAF